MKTTDMTPLAASGEALHTLASVAGGRYTVLGGGLPLRIDGTFLGGVGVSGEPRSRIRRSSRKPLSVSVRPSRRPGDTDVPQFIKVRYEKHGWFAIILSDRLLRAIDTRGGLSKKPLLSYSIYRYN
jgi:Haem-degrading